MRVLHRATAAAACVAVAALVVAAAAPADESSLSKARKATAAYHDLAAAESADYGLFTDAQGIACIEKEGEGAMGIHYVRGALVGDGAVDASTPQALIYEPTRNGRLRLVGVEYVVFQSAWDAEHSEPPTLFGQEFELVAAGNRYGLPPFYALHAWLFRGNPLGQLQPWNPRVDCR